MFLDDPGLHQISFIHFRGSAFVSPHVGHRGASGRAGGNGLLGRLRGARGADLGQGTREKDFLPDPFRKNSFQPLYSRS